LEIVYPDIQQCFLRCFNDGYNYPNLRPTAREWLEALRTGNDNLTICGRVDSHYYSRTYRKCYWCDRSTNLGIDIFPGVVKANSSILVQPTQSQASQTNQLVNSPRQVSQPPVYKPQSQPVKTPFVSDTKLRKLLIIATLGFIGTQLYGYVGQNLLRNHPDKRTPKVETLTPSSTEKTLQLQQTLIGHSDSVRSVAF
ncbi:MAG: hypothetical protein ACKO9G_02185, partial [Dolichospermum sp.]